MKWFCTVSVGLFTMKILIIQGRLGFSYGDARLCTVTENVTPFTNCTWSKTKRFKFANMWFLNKLSKIILDHLITCIIDSNSPNYVPLCNQSQMCLFVQTYFSKKAWSCFSLSPVSSSRGSSGTWELFTLCNWSCMVLPVLGGARMHPSATCSYKLRCGRPSAVCPAWAQAFSPRSAVGSTITAHSGKLFSPKNSISSQFEV